MYNTIVQFYESSLKLCKLCIFTVLVSFSANFKSLGGKEF